MTKLEHARAGAARVGGNAARVAGASAGEASDQWSGCKLQWCEPSHRVKRSPQIKTWNDEGMPKPTEDVEAMKG
jgi:hypothetical protein